MRRLPIILTFGIALVFLTTACDSGLFDTNSTTDVGVAEPHSSADARGIAPGQANIVEITGRHEGADYIFELSDTDISPGWTTFRLNNQSHSTHFAFLAQVPDGAITGAAGEGQELLEYWIESITNPFQGFMDILLDPDSDPRYSPVFPEWFGTQVPRGGPGLTAGMTTSETTVYLEEGKYIVECYVKNAEGDFHSYLGMIELLTVDGDESSAPEPRATLNVSLSIGNIEADTNVRPGQHTVAVHFENQPEEGYSHLLGHDVHLIRLEDDTDVEDVAAWMNWMLPDGLVSSSQSGLGPQKFLGGVQTMAPNDKGYFHVNLKPGRYAWISEVPEGEEMWKEFSVPFGQATGRR